MTAYEKLQLRATSSGGTLQKSNIRNSKEMFEAFFADDPSYKENVEVLNKEPVNLRMNKRRLIQGIPTMDIQAILTEGDAPFVAGDTFFYDDGYWLCTDSNVFHDIYRSGEVEECNYNLYWQNKDTLEIVSRWCVVKAPYSSGIDDDKVTEVGNSKYKIKMPYDSETSLFNYESRFLINLMGNKPIPYRIIDFDDVTYKNEFRKDGFLVIVVEQDQLRESDNVELMIADYIPPPPPQPEPVGLCEIYYFNKELGVEPELRVGGSARTFTARFYDDKNKLDLSIIPIWSLELLPSQDNKVKIIEQSGMTVRIQETSDDSKLIGTNFSLCLKNSTEEYSCKLIIPITSLF